MSLSSLSPKNPSSAVFVCEGGKGIGLGHVMRCLTLAKALIAKGWNCRFAVSKQTAALPAFSNSGLSLIVLEQCLSADCLFQSLNDQTDLPGSTLLVIDNYDIDHDFETSCRSQGYKTLVIEDMPRRSHDADMLLDTAFGRTAQEYKEIVPKDCKLLLGAQYVMLRPEFSKLREASGQGKQNSDSIKRVFISFGGVDGKGMCRKSLQALEKISDPLEIDIVIASSADNLDQLQEKARAAPHKVTVHIDTTKVAQLLHKADLAIGAGGISALERCALSVPSIVVCVADNQKDIVQALRDAGAIEYCGEPDEAVPERIERSFKQLAQDKQRLQTMAKAAHSFCDGDGVQRVSREIASLTA